MTALQCEICGGRLTAKSGGIFECDFCGMQYDKTRVQEMVQEIKGTVKVEGTVEVTGKVQIEGGSVKVEGGASAENFVKRGNMALADRKWEDATKFFDDALNLDAECAEAYLGKALAGMEMIRVEGADRELANLIVNNDFKKALRFAQPPLKEKLENVLQMAEEARLRAEKEAEEARLRAEQKEQEERECREAARRKIAPAQGLLVAGSFNTMGIRANGTVVAAGNNDNGQCNVSDWSNIIAVAAGWNHAVGLRRNGTVIAKGLDGSPQCNVGDWSNIIAVATGYCNTVGLRADGTVVAVGNRVNGKCDVSSWRSIVAIAAAQDHTVGLRADGTVVATKYTGIKENYKGQCEVSGWRDIIAISAGKDHTVGLRADGTVVATRYIWMPQFNYGQCNVDGWRNIVAVAAGSGHTVGLKSDGTVVAVGSNAEGQCNVRFWHDIVAVSASSGHTVGLKADGTVVATGFNESGQCNVNGWKLFRSIDTLEQEKAAAKEKCLQEVARKKASLEQERTALVSELSNLKGLFSGKRRKEIEERLAKLSAELKKL